MLGHRTRISFLFAAPVLITLIAAPGVALAGDSPSGYYYGSDDGGPAPSGSSVPFSMPVCNGAYGSYVGQLNQSGSYEYNVASYSNRANQNMLQGYGTGSQNVYFMLGPNDASPKATTVSEAQS